MSKSIPDLATVSLRPVTGNDQDFLRALFASTREAELAHLHPDQAGPFIDLQFRIQQQQYQALYPLADNSIILMGEEPIGRLMVARQEDKLVLIDISIQAAFRNCGVGSLLINGLMHEAAAQEKPLTLWVFKLNPALRLYERLGFLITRDENMYLEMTWRD
jgi:ribosomal protein S18 acetylase RimI-like enzyme